MITISSSGGIDARCEHIWLSWDRVALDACTVGTLGVFLNQWLCLHFDDSNQAWVQLCWGITSTSDWDHEWFFVLKMAGWKLTWSSKIGWLMDGESHPHRFLNGVSIWRLFLGTKPINYDFLNIMLFLIGMISKLKLESFRINTCVWSGLSLHGQPTVQGLAS
jgi:hypothetical protein